LQTGFITKKVFAWALYDWANSAFALSVLAVLFPVFNQTFWNVGFSDAEATARLAWVTAAASTVVCLTAPVFGTIADAGGYRKRFLFVLALMGAIATAALGLVGESNWPLALSFYLLASVGFYSSTVFYDSLLIDVTEPRYYSLVSTLGFSVGYLGGALLLALHTLMIASPSSFGLENATQAIRVAFVSVGAWWILFLLPLMRAVPENRSPTAVSSGVIRAAYSELRSTIKRVGQYRNIVIFLIAYWLYIGGVFTVIFMAVDYGQRLGFGQKDLVMALMITNFVGFPATILYGYFGHKAGPKAALYVALGIYILMCIWAITMTEVWQFYVMAVIIGCVQGGVQGLSRSLYASLIPAGQPGEFFGFYSMITKFAHVLGPILVGVAATLSDDPKYVLLSLLPMFIGGGMLLAVVRQETDTKAT
jgi:UMF1 family MFS transporter